MAAAVPAKPAMTGALELSREFFERTAKAKLTEDFPEDYPRIAAGLVGNGSECFGYDDELSRDHDWGIDFFLWVPEEDRRLVEPLNEWKRKLLDSHFDKPIRRRSGMGAFVGAMTVGDFYSSLIGYPEGPKTLQEWRSIPQENLALSVNGEVFADPLGQFTAVREYLLRFYPEQLRLKKIAARCMAIAQTGQYNFHRCIKREDWVTFRTVLSLFSDEVMGLVFLLNRVYKPYYKWAWRRLCELPVLGGIVSEELLRLSKLSGLDAGTFREQEECISRICTLLISELKNQGLSDLDDLFLAAHGLEIQAGISDAYLRRLPPQYE